MIHPGAPRHLHRATAQGEQPPGDAKEGLAVIVRRLSLIRLAAEAFIAVQNQRAIRGKIEAVGEVRRRGFDAPAPVHLAETPVVDEGVEGRSGDPRLPPAAARQRRGEEMIRGARRRRMAQVEGAVGPAFPLRAGLQSHAKQRPLRAIARAVVAQNIGGQIPPFDAKARMRAVILREDELTAGQNRLEPLGLVGEPGVAFGAHSGRGEKQQRGQDAAAVKRHLRRLSARRRAACARGAAPGERRRGAPRRGRELASPPTARERDDRAAASRRRAH